MVTIASLHDFPQYAPILAYWAFHEWYKHRSLEFDTVLKAYNGRTQSDSLPQIFVALDDTLPVGMATLKLDDLRSQKDINPWLSTLYVVPECRGNGIGCALIFKISERARELGFEWLHLFLGQREPARLERFYIKRGWEVIDNSTDNDGLNTKILRHCLRPDSNHPS